jgi:hypothetical protein
MNALPLGDRGLVLRHVASLLRGGHSLSDSLKVVLDALPDSDTRRSLAQFQAALGRGETVAAPDDPFLTFLVRAEVAGPDTLTLAAMGFEGETDAAVAASTGLSHLLMLLGGLAVAVCSIDLLVIPGLRSVLYFVPGPEAMHFTFLRLQLGGVFLVTALAGAVWLREELQGHMPGVAGLRAAASMRLYAAALKAGIDDATALSWIDPARPRDIAHARTIAWRPRELALLGMLARDEGMVAAAQTIAAERETEAGRTFRRWVASAPSLIGTIILWAVGGSLAALYLTIFSIAGAIK